LPYAAEADVDDPLAMPSRTGNAIVIFSCGIVSLGFRFRQIQDNRWPKSGKHILAQYDDETIVVYQAYSPAIGHLATKTGRFGDNWSRTRMSWIKPNFLWMMFRCGWGTKENQEVVLAIRLKRKGFDNILQEAVHSSHVLDVYGTREQWEHAVRRSNVRLQWDPDHDPGGAKLERRAIQLGLRGRTLERFADEWIVGIEDISGFVAEQRDFSRKGGIGNLVTPREEVCPIQEKLVAEKLGVDAVLAAA
jgi:Domain of unknown function (DUF4291)